MVLTKGIPLLVLYALQYINTPYVYSGQDFTKLDCSGLIVLILRDLNVIKSNADYTAQGLYDLLKLDERTIPMSTKASGSLLFYGQSVSKITHVDICVDPEEGITIGASGGDSTTKTIKDAVKRNARVKFNRIRKDLVASLTLDI